MKLFKDISLSQIKNGLKIQIDVIRALYYRELLTRISKIRFGLLGILIEPLGLIIIWLILIGFRRGFVPVYTLDLIIFLAAGNITYSVFNSISRRSIEAVQANQALFFYSRVRPVDTLFARALVEINLYVMVYLIVVLGYYFFQNKWLLDNLPLLLVSYISTSILAIGLGLILMTAGHRFLFTKQIVNFIFRPLYFLSGSFFSLAALPQWLKPWLSWNPLLHSIELSRKGFSDYYLLDPLISISYLFKTTIITFVIGLFIYVRNERILQTK